MDLYRPNNERISSQDLLGIIKDPKRYLEAFCKIKTKEGGLAPFILNEAQKDFFNTLRTDKRIIINKCRQIGFSTAATGYIYHKAITTPGITCALVGYNSSLTRELLDKVKTLLRSTPEEVRPRVEYNSKEEITFPQLDSKILVLPSTENVGRGYTLQACLLTEVAFWEKADEKMVAIENSVPASGQIIVESTPNGISNWYARNWLSEESAYTKKAYGWWWHYCIDDETEILTADGWKKRTEFKKGDRHFSVNLKTKEVEVKEATDLFESDFDGEMVHFESQGLDMMVTPNHRCVSRVYKGYMKEETWKDDWVLKKAEDINKGDHMPLSTNGWSENVDKKYSDAFVELIGWIITEGTFEKYLISIAQNPGDKLDRIVKSCNDLNLKFTVSRATEAGCMRVRIWSGSTKEIKKVLSKSKELPLKFILDLTHDQLVILQKTLIDGDGWKIGKSEFFCQKDASITDNFQILAALIGRSSRSVEVIGKTNFYVTSIRTADFARRFRKTYKRYKGKVWCPTNANGTIIIRRNGKVMITGQSEDEINLIKARMNNPMKFAQEYSLELLASGRLVFDQDVIKRQSKNIVNVGDKYKDKKGEIQTVTEWNGLRMYKEPEAGGVYVVGADTSEGVVGGDYSTCSILDRETGEEVGFYRGLMAPDKFGKKLDEWGRKFNNALMVVEINNHGLTVLTILKQLMYPTLYFRPSQLETMGTSYSDRLGWKTTKLTRPLMIDDLGQALREDSITVHSKEIVNEMTTFIYDKQNNPTAQSGSHDDGIFSLGIAFQGFKILWKGELSQIDYNHHLPISTNY